LRSEGKRWLDYSLNRLDYFNWFFIEDVIKAWCFLYKVCSWDNDWPYLRSKLISNYICQFWWLSVPFSFFNFINIKARNFLKIGNIFFNFDCTTEFIVLSENAMINWNIASVFVIIN